MEQLLIVFSNAVDGRDAEFNEWYSYVHVRDVMRMSRAAIAVQRFRLAENQFLSAPVPLHRYLAIYEGDNHGSFTDGHAQVFTPEMPISTAFLFDDVREAYYEPLAARAIATDRTGGNEVIVERISRDCGVPDLASWYMDTRMPQIMGLSGVMEGVFSHIAAEQMLKPQPDSHYVAVYRTNDMAATLQAWQGDVGDSAFAPGTVQRGCYTPVMLRLTAHAARFPTAAEADRAARARLDLGPNVYTGFPEEVLSQLA